MPPTFNRRECTYNPPSNIVKVIQAIKMKFAISAAAASTFLLYSVNAQLAPKWGQCGGIGWPGPFLCQPDQVCTYSNACKCFSTLDILTSHMIIPLHRPLPMYYNNHFRNRHRPNAAAIQGNELIRRIPSSQLLLRAIPSPESFQFWAVRVSYQEGLHSCYNAPIVSVLINDQLRFIHCAPRYCGFLDAPMFPQLLIDLSHY
ncbi:hypothetical protein BD779DRAFT_1044649 [Infundibulicybe gibba]|nr:hypothetical protein BD779DRAFT_1044649 [Infundibulicybe gibba]